MASGVYTHTHIHTHTHTHTLADESDYKKPGAPATGRRVPGLKITISNYIMIFNPLTRKCLKTGFAFCKRASL